LLEIDPVALVKGHHQEGFVLAQYVNDRPYAASSLLAVALQRLFRTALAGRCDARPDMVAQPLPMELHLPAVPCRGGTDPARRLFEHLGWQVSAVPVPLDPELPEWGDSPYVDLKIVGMQRLSDALNQVYVLLPVLDDAKHYWVGPDEVDKLIRAGGAWLASHPDKELIIQRYLDRRQWRSRGPNRPGSSVKAFHRSVSVGALWLTCCARPARLGSVTWAAATAGYSVTCWPIRPSSWWSAPMCRRVRCPTQRVRSGMSPT
jgi:3' terminal RNA ribose 2'-O-methyltransferase Hen1